VACAGHGVEGENGVRHSKLNEVARRTMIRTEDSQSSLFPQNNAKDG
jgi:hypothetical protein